MFVKFSCMSKTTDVSPALKNKMLAISKINILSCQLEQNKPKNFLPETNFLLFLVKYNFLKNTILIFFTGIKLVC